MDNFTYWLENVADIPEEDENGNWRDLETGFQYDPKINYEACEKGTQRKTLSEKAMSGRETAKAFGGKALKGSFKQKEWAEKIRAGKLSSMTDEQAKLACDPNGLLTHSKFWIENRFKSGTEIAEFVTEQKGMLKQYRAYPQTGHEEEKKILAAKYNALTEKWLDQKEEKTSTTKDETPLEQWGGF
ncbi:hypothetical protein [Solidesulfovibrio carbinolicus]|uniref:hypothetical protein n=1 Tax=Solidesulfovibrio carbinolicus TaxID=296842 RepID=UPI001011651E|nr:hypothetical protein [Solidesulfovibrio carbinolicus]